MRSWKMETEGLRTSTGTGTVWLQVRGEFRRGNRAGTPWGPLHEAWLCCGCRSDAATGAKGRVPLSVLGSPMGLLTRLCSWVSVPGSTASSPTRITCSGPKVTCHLTNWPDPVPEPTLHKGPGCRRMRNGSGRAGHTGPATSSPQVTKYPADSPSCSQDPPPTLAGR